MRFFRIFFLLMFLFPAVWGSHWDKVLSSSDDKSSMVVARISNGYVAADIDLDGDDGNFEEGGDPAGTGTYKKLTFSWPGDGWTCWMIFYVDGVWARSQTEAAGDPADDMPPSDTQYVKVEDSTVVIEWWDWNGVFIRLLYRPVSLGTSPGEIEEIRHSIVMKPVDGSSHNCGAMIYFDTMIDTNDGAPISTSYGYNANSSIFYAPSIPTLWRAYSGTYPPAPGDLRALGVLVGYEATMPDVFWYGQCWSPSDLTYHSIVFGWDDAQWATATGNLYDDSAVMVKWYDRPVSPGDSALFVTYFGIGNFDTTSVTLIHEPPTFSYDCDGTMNPDTVHFTFMVINGGTDSICDVSATLEGTGFNVVSTENPLDMGTMAGYGGSYNIDWGVLFDPSVWGTTQQYIVTIDFSDCFGYDSSFSDTFSVDIPHPSNIDLTVTADDTMLCAGDTIQLHASYTGAVGTVTYHWLPETDISDPNATDPFIYPDHSTAYTFYITDENGCMDYEGIIISVSNLSVDAGSSFVACAGDSAQIGGTPAAFGGITPYTYSWSPTAGLSDPSSPNPFASPSSPTWYYLTVTDNAGCSAVDSVFVDISTAPYSYNLIPDSCGGVISCNPPEFQFVVADASTSVDETTFIVEIDGTSYDWASGVMTYSDSVLTITPPSSYSTGDTVRIRLVNYENTNGCEGEEDSCYVIVDADAPSADMTNPLPGSTISNPAPNIVINITDSPAGVDTNSFNYISVYLNGAAVSGFTYDWSDPNLTLSGFSFTEGGTVLVCIDSLFDDVDYSYCPPNSDSICWSFVVSVGNVVAYPIEPDDGEYTACDDQILTIHLEGTVNAVDATTILLTVDGTPYTIDSAEVTYDGISEILTFDGGGSFWSDNDTVCVSLWAVDIFGGEMDDTLRYCFYTDFSPPYISAEIPADGDTVFVLEPSFSFDIFDDMSGLESLVVVVDDTIVLSVDSSCVSWDGTSFSFDAACAGITYPPDEDVEVCISAWDSPDYCPPNELDTCWTFVVTRECSLVADAGPDTSICSGTILVLGGPSVALSGTAPFSYEWYIVGETTPFSYEEHPTVSPTSPTSYAVVVTDGMDCVAFDTVFVDAHDCAGPVASFVSPLEGYTSCDPESIVINLTDPDGVDESSIQLRVNGVVYTTDDWELRYSDPYLVFVPSPMWADGSVINVALISADDMVGNSLSTTISESFTVDLSPPYIWNNYPSDDEIVSSPHLELSFYIDDDISGLDTSSIDITIGSYHFSAGSTCITISPVDTYWLVVVDSMCIDMTGCDTITVHLLATDTTDFCSDNALDVMWHFSTDCVPPVDSVIAIPELLWWSCDYDSIVIAVEDSAPGVDISSLSLFATDGGSYTSSAAYGDAEVYFDSGSGSIVWHPSPPLPETGTITAQISISDLLGNFTTDEWTFNLDRSAPEIVEFHPACGGTVYTASPDIYVIATDEGCGTISSYSATIDGTIYSVVVSGDTFRVDGVPALAGGTDYEVCWHLEDCAGDVCEPNATDTCCTFTVSGGGPYAFIRSPEDSAFVACSTFSVPITIFDVDGIIPESTEVQITVDGVSTILTIDSAAISYTEFADSLCLIWTPPIIDDGMTVEIEVVAARDSIYNALGGSDVITFFFDLVPPTITNLLPAPGTVVGELYPTICADISDAGSGVDWSTVIITVEGVDFDTLDSAVSVDLATGQICLDPSLAFSDWSGGDTIDVCISAGDQPDTCGPNVSDTCWNFIIASGGPLVEVVRPAESVFVACNPDSIVWAFADSDGIDFATLTITITEDGTPTTYHYGDAELHIAGDTVSFVPSGGFADGSEIYACVDSIADSLGNFNDDNGCIFFTVDFSPPTIAIVSPLPDEVVSSAQPVINLILSDATSGVDTLGLTLIVDGVSYTISDDCLEYFDDGDSLIFDPSLCDVSFSGGDTIEVCLSAPDLADEDFCGPNTLDTCWNFTIAADAPIVYPISPTDSSVSSCDPETVKIYIHDGDGVDASTIIIVVNGDTFDISDEELTYSNDTLYFVPSTPFSDGEEISVSVVSAADMLGNNIAEPMNYVFFMDYSPPVLVLSAPADSSLVVDNQQDIVIDITDAPAGVDSSSVIVVIDGNTIEHDNLVWSRIPDGYEIRYIPENNDVVFEDTIAVEVSAYDEIYYCDDNFADTIWTFVVLPEVKCDASPKPITPNNDGYNDRVVFKYPEMFTDDAELVIYDVQSREVYRRSITHSELGMSGGTNEWDGTDSNGNVLPQGVYIYVILVDGEVVCNGTVAVMR